MLSGLFIPRVVFRMRTGDKKLSIAAITELLTCIDNIKNGSVSIPVIKKEHEELVAFGLLQHKMDTKFTVHIPIEPGINALPIEKNIDGTYSPKKLTVKQKKNIDSITAFMDVDGFLPKTQEEAAIIILSFYYSIKGIKGKITEKQIERVKKRLSSHKMAKIMVSMWNNQHNKFCLGQSQNGDWVWSLDYILKEYETKDSIELSYNRKRDVVPTKQEWEAIAKFKHLLPSTLYDESTYNVAKGTSFGGNATATDLDSIL